MDHTFFQNRECKYFPCHSGVDEEDFNCLFCYCPLYYLGKECGGDYYYKDNIKVCTACNFPHRRENYTKILEKLRKENR